MLIEIRISPNHYRPSRPGRHFVLKCDICGKTYEKKFAENYAELHKWGDFCGGKCCGRYRAAHPEVYMKSVELMNTDLVREKAKQTRRKHLEDGTILPSHLGKKHSKEAKEMMRQRKRDNPPIGEKNGMFGRHHSSEAREKMSEHMSRRILLGNFVPYGTRNKRGHYVSTKSGKEHVYKSSWEFAYMKFLDESVNITSWDYESIRIVYYYDNHRRWYVPDFLITHQDGSKTLVEIKPKEFTTSIKQQLKKSAAIVWCETNNVKEYLVLTGDHLRELGIL